MKRIYLALISILALAGAAGCAGDSDPPARVSDLTFFDHSDAVIFNGRVKVGAAAGQPDTRILAWTAPGDDGRDGQASLYEARYVRQHDLDRWGLTNGAGALATHWGDAHRLVNEPNPGGSGDLTQLFLPRVFSAENVWFAIRTLDEVGQESPTSDVVGPIKVTPIFMPLRPSTGIVPPPVGFGAVVHWAGDIDGNGYADLLVGSPSLGAVTVHPGGATTKFIAGVKNANGVKVKKALAELLPDFTIAGDAADEFGAAVSGLARVTSDRTFEFSIGAPGLDNGATLDTGAVYVFHGRHRFPDVLDADSADTIISGTLSGARFGAALSTASVIAGDETINFIAGAPAADGRGYAYIFRAGIKSPATDADAIVVVKGAAAGDELGAEVEVIGDVNGDGIPDLAIGAPGHDNGALADAGAVYVFYGGDAGAIDFSTISGQRVIDLATDAADVVLLGNAAGRRFGQSISIGGDIADNGTAADDLIVGGVDCAFVFIGGVAGTLTPFPPGGTGVNYTDNLANWQLAGAAGSGLGRVVIGTGDLNRDQHDDLAIAVPGLEQVFIFYGPVSGTAPDEIISSPAAGIGFASGLAGPGDVNLDGFPDLLIAAPGSGQAYLTF